MENNKPKFLNPSELASKLDSTVEKPDEPAVAGLAAGRPAFLDPARAQSIGYVEDEVHKAYNGGPDTPADFAPWDDTMEPNPESGHPLKPRHRELARLHALGKTNNEICAILGYSTSRVSILVNNPAIRREVDRYRNRLYDRDLTTAIKDLGYDSVEVLEQMLRSDDAKLKDRVDAAKWVLEKVSGKPRQEISVESQSLNRFFDLLQDLKDRGETLDITPDSNTTVNTTVNTSESLELPGSRFDTVVDTLFDDDN